MSYLCHALHHRLVIHTSTQHVFQGANTALGDLSGTQEPAAVLQGHCEEALPTKEGQYHCDMH